MKASIIGTGFGARVVAPIYKKAGIEVEVYSPRDPEAVKQACSAPVDFVSIHSPPFMHRDHVFLAVENGRNVICDKPFGRSANEAREMLEAAEAAGVIHLVNYEFRQEGVRRKAKQLIEEGAIGAVRHMSCTAIMSGSRVPLQTYRWLWDRDLGGGWIGAFGSHIIDAFRWWAGEIATADGVCRTEITHRPDADGESRLCTAEDGFTACLTFENNASAVIETAYAASVNRPYVIEIYGTDGALIMDYGRTLELKHSDGTEEKFDFPAWKGDIHEPAMAAWVQLACQAISEKRQIEPSFRDGLACAEVMDKLRSNAVWLRQEGPA